MKSRLPANHKLHVIFFATAMSSSLYHLIAAMTLSLLYQLGHKSVLAFFEIKVLRVTYDLKQFTLIVGL